MHKPRVSVVMSCYNAGGFLHQAVESILAQSYKDYEFIIIEDGSSDDTLSQIKSYTDSRIIILENEKNLGLSASLNRGIEKAQGGYIARMDADDVAMVDRLEKQVNYLDQHKEVDILGTSVRLRSDVNKDVNGSINMPEIHDDIVKRIFRKTLVLHPTIMLRREVYEVHGIYDPELRWAEDTDLWDRIYDKVTWANLSEELLIYTQKKKLNWKIVSNNLKVKVTNLRRRGLLFKYSHVILLDILNYTKRLALGK